MDLGSALAPGPSSGPAMRLGIVTQASPLLVRVGAAATATPAAALGSYALAVNDVVVLLEQGADRVVLGSAATSQPWIALTMSSPWVNYGAGWNAAQYRKIGDKVEIRGLIAGGFNGSTIAVMSVGYRPPGGLIYTTEVEYGTGLLQARLDILSDGTLRTYFNSANPASYLSINIAYSTI